MTSMSAEDFLVVSAGGQRFALPAIEVMAAVAIQPVTPLPFVPDFIEGLVNVNERIVPQLDLACLLGASSAVGGELVLVDSARSPCALRVAEILGKAEVDASRLETLASGDEALPVSCRFDWEGDTVLVLDVEALGARIAAREAPPGERGLLGRMEEVGAVEVASATLDCIEVAVSGERYAFGLADVVEILDLPRATPVPGAAAGVEGLAPVRGEVLIVLSLALLLGSTAGEGTPGSVVVVEREEVRYGLRVDAVHGLRQVESGLLRRIDDPSSDIEGVLPAGDLLIGLLTPARLITDARHQQWRLLVPRQQRDATRHVEREQVVLQVILGEELYGFALSAVRRIVDYRLAEPVPAEAGSLVGGAINIEGRVVPVLDLGARLRCAAANEGAWVIVEVGSQEWAVAVREATGIVAVPESALEPVRGGESAFIAAIARVEDRLVSMLSLAPLLREEALA